MPRLALGLLGLVLAVTGWQTAVFGSGRYTDDASPPRAFLWLGIAVAVMGVSMVLLAVLMQVRAWRKNPDSLRRALRRMRPFLIGAGVSVLAVAGVAIFVTKVSGLEVPAPNGVHVILAPKPLPGPMPSDAKVVADQVTALAEQHPDDLNTPGYDWGRHMLIVNVANFRGLALVSDLVDLPFVKVRTDALSMTESDAMQYAAFTRIDAVTSASYDAVNDRIIVVSSQLRGVLGTVKAMFGTSRVALRYEPFEGLVRTL